MTPPTPPGTPISCGWKPRHGRGASSTQAWQRLFTHGEIAATPMTGWGPSGERYLRLVFANEPIERLGDLQTRFDAALA